MGAGDTVCLWLTEALGLCSSFLAPRPPCIEIQEGSALNRSSCVSFWWTFWGINWRPCPIPGLGCCKQPWEK